MKSDCHIHMVLDGVDWKAAIARHRIAPNKRFIREILQTYKDQGYEYLRDGGDRWGVGKAAREIAKEYGITYRTPLSPLCKKGHYGAFIGESYENFKEYTALVKRLGSEGCDFIKIMISGLMDFDRFGVLTEAGLPENEIRELIHIAHEEGFAVMAHCNGARTAEAAAASGVDSIEHGAYLDRDALQAMAENRTVWVPTLSTVGNLRGKGRFSENDVIRIFESTAENCAAFAAIGGLLAPGTDAGAWSVPHGSESEEAYLRDILGENADPILHQGIHTIKTRFLRK
ncbi:MAG: amidohydrolase family protein [Oscillospiraceae bacterium]|nr:amidohydrolase family protein [Oscillospiraceae bacterium]